MNFPQLSIPFHVSIHNFLIYDSDFNHLDLIPPSVNHFIFVQLACYRMNFFSLLSIPFHVSLSDVCLILGEDMQMQVC